jgi:NRPS condensation-like uncharacterized protein
MAKIGRPSKGPRKRYTAAVPVDLAARIEARAKAARRPINDVMLEALRRYDAAEPLPEELPIAQPA